MPLRVRVGYDSAALAFHHAQRSPRGGLSGLSPFWEFAAALENISAGNLRALWLPQRGHTTTTVSKPGDLVWTYDADITTRITPQGDGVLVTFVSASTQYATTPAIAGLSFPEPQPFSIMVLASVTDTAARRNLFSKFRGDNANAEHNFEITPTDKLRLTLWDASAAVGPNRSSDAVITQGSLHVFGVSYVGTGGALAANGIVTLQDGVVIASTAANNAAYVAMEPGSNEPTIGGYSSDHGSGFDGSMGFAAIYAANLSAAQHRAGVVAANKFYRLNL